MKVNKALAVGCLLLATACSMRGAPADRGATPALVTLSIVGTNDLHGGVIARDGRGGLAPLGGYLKNLRAARARDNGAVLLIDGGDMFQGTLESNVTEGASVVAAYNTLGYSAAAVGNHEFDFGPVGPNATARGSGEDPLGALKARGCRGEVPVPRREPHRHRDRPPGRVAQRHADRNRSRRRHHRRHHRRDHPRGADRDHLVECRRAVRCAAG